MQPRVCLIITAWNQVEKTMACLETAVAQTYPHCDVLLVDNGSEPDLQQAVRTRFPQVEILTNAHNLGFAGGYNSGLRYALARAYDLIFLANNDTLIAPDCLEKLVAAVMADPTLGLVTAKIYYAHDPQRIWTVGNRYHPWLLELRGGGQGEVDRGQWNTRQEIEFAPFCGVLLTRGLLETVGLLDEAFFLYYEDMDYCRRIRATGYKLQLEPDAHMWHAVSTSSGGRGSPAERYWMAQSSGRYFRKHGRGWRMLLIVPYRLASACKLTLNLLRHVQWRSLWAYWYGLLLGWTSGRATRQPPRWIRHA